MAKKFYETPEFKKLQAAEYERLANHDFPDIEGGKFIDIEREESDIINPEIIDVTKMQQQRVYRELCYTILREFKFRKDIHRVIFEKHAEGKSERDIQKFLETSLGLEFTQQGINQLVKRIHTKFATGL